MKSFKFIPYYAYKLTIGAFSSRTTSTIAYVAAGTVLIVAASLTIMCAIMQGFQTATLTQLQTVWSDITVDAYGEELATEAIAKVLDKQSYVRAYAFQSRTQAPIILNGEINRVATIIAIDPTREPSVSKLCGAATTPCSTIQKALEKRQVLVGSMLAEDLALTAGEHINIGTVNKQDKKESSLALQTIPLIIAGTVHTGLEDLDASIVIMSLETFEDIFDEGPTAVAIAARSHTTEEVVTSLKQVLSGMSVYSFSQRNPAILAALAMEQLVTWLLIILMTIIALSSLVAMMLMVLSHNQRQLLICLLHGCSALQLRLLTIATCACITIPATIIGIILGSITAIIIRDVLPIKLPPLYYVATVPVELSWQIDIIMTIGAVIAAIMVGAYAAHTIIPKSIIQELS